jgi:hypothetical protein
MTHMAEYPDGKSFSFAEIVHGRDSSVRVTDDGLLYAVDLVMVITGKDRDHAGQALRDISDKHFSPGNFSERNTGGSGNSKTKLVNFHDAIQLVMVLPGKIAKETRAQFADIIKRYIGGDQTLITEINANASSTSPIAQLAQALMDDDVGVKRRREEVGGKPTALEVGWAFDYQKEALELRHKRDLQLLENDYNEEIIATEKENKILRKESDEAIEYMEQLESELEILKKEEQDVLFQYQDLMKGVRILSGPYMSKLKM